MNIIVIVIFVLLIGYVFIQRAQIAFLKRMYKYQGKLYILTNHNYISWKNRSAMLELLLSLAGHDIERAEKGDFAQIEPSPAKRKEIWEEFQRLQSMDRSEEIRFKTEMELHESKS